MMCFCKNLINVITSEFCTSGTQHHDDGACLTCSIQDFHHLNVFVGNVKGLLILFLLFAMSSYSTVATFFMNSSMSPYKTLGTFSLAAP